MVIIKIKILSNTFKHKDKGKYHNKIIKYNDVCDSTKNMWDRHNSDISEDKQELFKIKSKIAEKELKQQIKTNEYNFKEMDITKTVHENKQELNKFFVSKQEKDFNIGTVEERVE